MKLDKTGRNVARSATFFGWTIMAWIFGTWAQATASKIGPSEIAPLFWAMVAFTAFFFGWGWLTEVES